MRLFACTALLLVACHTQQVGRADRAPQAEGKPTPKDTSVHMDISSGRPVHSTPRQYLSRESVLKIQRALQAKGEHVSETGKLDATTQAALRRFQKSRKQPDTGMPDFGTLDLLGLDANELYGGKPDKETGSAELEIAPR
jgi:peptidoglycan hydrolase-like protein with peptidoglycan-binding domain